MNLRSFRSGTRRALLPVAVVISVACARGQAGDPDTGRTDVVRADVPFGIDGGSDRCTPGASRECYSGPAATRGIGICTPGMQTCDTGGRWPATCAGEVAPHSMERCGNGMDDDCNMMVDDGCDCMAGATRPCFSGAMSTRGVGICRDGVQTCNAMGRWNVDCIGETRAAATETCANGMDDDCNGAVDNGCGPMCGDGTCAGGETCTSCPGDCGACPARCGDGTCNGGETCTSCAGDCGACPARCGDGTCNGGETCTSCAGDCGACPARCGDGTCNGGETCTSCAGDCGACPARCGDGTCNGGETCTSCAGDCGACPARCGDGTCNGGETCTSCAGDCGACPARCGDGSCNGGETCTTCAGDCGACPDPCATSTTCGTCAARGTCGWCRNLSRCITGTSAGPTGGACSGTNWAWLTSACDACRANTSCATCTAGATCGWCTSSSLCSTGALAGPTAGGCTMANWRWVSTDCTDACMTSTDCSSCASRAGCGWCRTLSRCLSGTSTGSSRYACSGAASWVWLPSSCP